MGDLMTETMNVRLIKMYEIGAIAGTFCAFGAFSGVVVYRVWAYKRVAKLINRINYLPRK
jgi:hypothetical protein